MAVLTGLCAASRDIGMKVASISGSTLRGLWELKIWSCSMALSACNGLTHNNALFHGLICRIRMCSIFRTVNNTLYRLSILPFVDNSLCIVTYNTVNADLFRVAASPSTNAFASCRASSSLPSFTAWGR